MSKPSHDGLSDSSAKKLRERAEQQVEQPEPDTSESPQMLHLIHELQIHRVELEMQNDELHRTSADLEQSRDRYRDLFHFAPSGYLIIEPDSRIRVANVKAGELLGVSAGQLPGRRLSAFLDRDTADQLARHLYEVFRSQGRAEIELDILRARGEKRGVRLITRWREDNPPSCSCILIDEGEARESALALEEREARLRAVLDTAVDAIISVDSSGRVHAFSRGAEAMFGYDATEVVGKRFGSFLVDDAGGARRRKRFDARRAAGDDTARELRARRKDGTIFPVEVRISSRAQDDAAFIGIIRDISMLKSAEAEVSETHDRELTIRQRYEALFQGLPIPCALVDPDMQVAAVNEAALNITGMTRERVVGHSIAELFPGLASTPFFDAGGTALQPHTPKTITHDWTFPDGRKLWLRTSVLPVLEGTLVLAEDVTKAQRHEDRLRQSQKMEAVGTMAGGIAHDFNNLLMGFAGCCRMLVDELQPEGRVAEYFSEMLRSTERGTDMTRRLLKFTRDRPVQPRVQCVDNIIEAALPLLTRVVGEGIVVAPQLAGSRRWVNADAGQIEQVVMNLCINARDAMPNGGELTIRTCESAHENRPGLELVVSDTGTGMDRRILARAFDPFFTTKPDGHGTGLGLASVYSTVRQMSGHIEIDSAPGHGTRVMIWWPSADQQETPATTPRVSKSTPRPGDSEVVLVVEDEPLVRLAVRNDLEKHGYHVLTAESRGEALRAFEGYPGPVSLLLSDVVLPGPSGPSLAAELRDRNPELAVIFMSAYPKDLLIAQGRIPVDAVFVQKPFDADDLADVVQQVRLLPSAQLRLPGMH